MKWCKKIKYVIICAVEATKRAKDGKRTAAGTENHFLYV
jgi:hypothetical protein